MGLIVSIKDTARQAVEAATGGKVTIMYDDQGYPSYMVRIPKFNVEDIDASLGSGVHPAFVVNGVELSEIWIGQYQAIVHDNRALSLPGQDPTTNINFDTALTRCSAKGAGWHLMTNAEWAAIALWAHKNGTLPRGNNDYGRDESAAYETGTRQDGESYAPGDTGGIARTLTGSGPSSWRHDHTFAGIADLNGNVWEWNGGLRLVAGEIQILANNNAAAPDADHGASSSDWVAIRASDGALVAPGTSGTLKYDSVSSGTTGAVGVTQIDDVIDNSNDPGTGSDDGYTTGAFESLAPDSGITVPDIMTQLALAPALSALGGDYLWARNYGERLPIRGGYWSDGSEAGVFSLSLYTPRSRVNPDIGFRPAFCAI